MGKGKSESGKGREYPAQDFYLKYSGSGLRVNKVEMPQTVHFSKGFGGDF